MWRFFLIWLMLAGSVGYAVYHLKYEVTRKERLLAQINRQILADQEAIQVLKAEWSFLNQTQRIEEIARTHLGMEPLTIKQILQVTALPMKQRTGPRQVPRPSPLDTPASESNPLFEEGANGLPDTPESEEPLALSLNPTSPSLPPAMVRTAKPPSSPRKLP